MGRRKPSVAQLQGEPPAEGFLTLEQVRAIGSPPKLDLIDALGTLGASTVSDLANYLAKSPNGLYYHLRKLEEVGLVRSELRRGLSGREEAIYSLAHLSRSINPVQNPEYREEVKRGVKLSLLRLERDHDGWVEMMQHDPQARDFGMLSRSRVRLTQESAAELKRRLAEIMQFVSENETREGVPLSVVFAVFPTKPLD